MDGQIRRPLHGLRAARTGTQKRNVRKRGADGRRRRARQKPRADGAALPNAERRRARPEIRARGTHPRKRRPLRLRALRRRNGAP